MNKREIGDNFKKMGNIVFWNEFSDTLGTKYRNLDKAGRRAYISEQDFLNAVEYHPANYMTNIKTASNVHKVKRGEE